MFGVDKVIEIVTEPAVESVKDKCNYIWNYKRYVKDLENECKNLESGSEVVKHEVEEARDNARVIEKEVLEWLEDVNKEGKKARDVKEKKQQKSCFRGSVINPYTRYKIGKEAADVVESIQRLETRKSGLRRICYRSAPGKVTGLYDGISYHVTPSRESILRDINKALMYSDVKAVGVYGPSGVGKSTLMRNVMEQVHRRSLNYDFDKVALATVSRDPDLEKIQGELAHSLGLTFGNERGVDQKANQLRAVLGQGKKILIILDDIWKRLELDKLGIPTDNKGVKLLLTSRKMEGLRSEMDCEQNFELKAFHKDEAMDLFKRIVGCEMDESLSELVGRRVVKECACLPVYIVPLAAKLKTHAPSTWKSILDELMKSDNQGKNQLIMEALEDGEAKNLFLLCGQIGNQIIAIEDLLVYAMGLGLFQGISSINKCRERLMTLLENLKSFCLLEDYVDDYIKIHDVMSDASLSMASSETQYSLVLRDGKQLRASLERDNKLDVCKSISLPFVGEISGGLPEKLKCPKLNMFLSYADENCKMNFPNSFFKEMKELMVLDVCGVPFGSLPSSIGQLRELQTLCLDRCVITNLDIIGQLKKLQVLTLRGCGILVLPKEIGELTDLRLLVLSGCYGLAIIEHGALGRLANLEELYLPENYENWQDKGFGKARASLDELVGMSNLTSLTICIPNLTGLPHDFPLAKLKRYKIVIKGWEKKDASSDDYKGGGKINSSDAREPSLKNAQMTTKDYIIEYDKMRTLRIKVDISDRSIILKDWVQTALRCARKLELLGWRGYEKSITELSKQGFLELKHISIQNSPGIQYVFRPKDRFPPASSLETLHLERLINLEKIYQSNLHTNSFINLKILRIKACHKLQNVFPPSIAKGLSRIQEIEISDCRELSDIVAFNEKRGMEHKIVGHSELVLKLRKLVLSGLPQFSSFCAKGHKKRGDHDDALPISFLDGRQVSLPILDSLALSDLPKLRKISEGKFPVKLLQSLRLLKVKSCENLSNILEDDLHLKNLEMLTIESCDSMETIFNLKKSSHGPAFESQDLGKLTKLELVGLKSLKTIWPIKIKEGSLMRNLNQLEVSHCDELTYLFSSSMIKSLQGISYIFVDNCKKMETIIFMDEENDISDTGARDTIEFSSLIELRISNMETLAVFAGGNRPFYLPRLKKLEIRLCPVMTAFVPPQNERKSSMSNANEIAGASPPMKKLVSRVRSGVGMALPKVERKMSRTEEDGGGAEHKPFFSMKVILPNLEKLVLSSLGSFTSIWKSFPSDDSFCKLESIEIEKCNSLQILVLPEQRQQDLKETASFKLQLENAEIMDNSSGKQELGFPFLTNIKIDECAQLKSLFSDSIARTLFELENLHISSCKKMVEVVFTQNEEMMMFDKLCSLKLEDLDELQCFSTGSAEYYFPCLKELWISRCTKFKAFIMSPNSSTDANVKSTPSFLEKVIIPELEKLHIEQLELEEIFSSMLFCQVKDLEVEACHQLLTVIPSFILPYMQSLESLTVKNCNSVRVIFEFGDSTFVDRKFTSSKSWKLKTIRLHGLPQLEHICQNENFLEFFPFNDLEILAVESCKLLRSIFKPSTTKILAKLQELSIAFCESIEHVVEHGQDCSIGGTNKIILHQLAVLKFSYLPKLSSFCSMHMTEWPSLVDVELDNCDIVEAFAANSGKHLKPLFLLEKVAFPKMESLKISWLKNMKELWNIGDERTECSFKALSKLRVLEILYCNGLSTIFPSKMVKGLGELEKLKVGDCDSVEQVFQVQGFRQETEFNDNDGSTTIDFSLRELVLEQLPALNHVWNIVNSEGLNLTCEKLQRVSINYCGNLKYMFPASIARSLDQLVAVKIRGCTGMEEIVQREVYGTDDNNNRERYQSIPNLKVIYLKLANLPELTSIPCKDCLAFKLINCPKAKVHAPSLEEKSGGCDIINSTEKMNGKVNMFSNLKQLATDTEGLHEMRFLDVFANLPYLFLKTIDEAAAKRFPWKFLLENFHNLEFLRIDDCYFEDLFALEDEKAQEENKEITSHNSKQERPHLQSLRRLELHDLPKLEQVLKKDSAMEGILDIISDLLVWNCPSLKHLFQAAASFRNLAFVDVYRCGEMVYLLTSSAARCLEQLTVLDVSHCNIMKEIVIEDQDGNGGADDICFPRLKEIRLAGLNELRSFCSSESCKFRFPSLESVSMENLPELKGFCQGGFEAPLLHDIATEGEEKEASRLKGVVEQEG